MTVLDVKTLSLSILVLATWSLSGQTMRNFGQLEIHESSEVGVFHGLVNDGWFKDSHGLVGFYGEKSALISGENPIHLLDVEIAKNTEVTLETPVLVSGHVNFVYGDFVTSKTEEEDYIHFLQNSEYNGISNITKVNGYARATVSERFLFPVGNQQNLRPFTISTEIIGSEFLAKYDEENPETMFPFVANDSILKIDAHEYWTLKGKAPVAVTLNWNNENRMEIGAESIDNIHIVGFDRISGLWKDLGAVENTGDLSNGFVTSTVFVPNAYDAITFGIVSHSSTVLPAVETKGYHYIISPNGDNINDRLIIEELAAYETNQVQIYDRNGLMVFSATNYTDEFNGHTSTNISSIKRDSGLPQGIYFYIASVNGDKFTLQGFLYLDR